MHGHYVQETQTLVSPSPYYTQALNTRGGIQHGGFCIGVSSRASNSGRGRGQIYQFSVPNMSQIWAYSQCLSFQI